MMAIFGSFFGLKSVYNCFKKNNYFQRDSIHGRQVGFAVLAVAAEQNLWNRNVFFWALRKRETISSLALFSVAGRTPGVLYFRISVNQRKKSC